MLLAPLHLEWPSEKPHRLSDLPTPEPYTINQPGYCLVQKPMIKGGGWLQLALFWTRKLVAKLAMAIVAKRQLSPSWSIDFKRVWSGFHPIKPLINSELTDKLATALDALMQHGLFGEEHKVINGGTPCCSRSQGWTSNLSTKFAIVQHEWSSVCITIHHEAS